ncbi:response regulator [Hydrogenophaga sp. NH-16]|uniref:response regulator n=1 Tax=Hydrogenophaga sp. NH-16 TaxID=2184519 RepID=UPI000FDA8261|nr:response regulator [Hydrogenophaga sp. NH-16]
MNSPHLKPRLLLVEDDEGRIDRFSRWVEGSGFVLVTVRSGGQALGMLSKGSTEAIAGILLDHDLSDSPFTQMDHMLSTSDIMPLIQRGVRRTTPILIHSHNANKPVWMQKALESSGFTVTRIRFALLADDPSKFQDWLADVRDNWDFESD